MREPKRRETVYAQAIAQRDEAIADRDFILNFVRDLGAALTTDAMAAAIQIRALSRIQRRDPAIGEDGP